MEKVRLASKFASFSEHWSPKIIGELNGQHVKVFLDLIMQGRGPADAVMLVTSVLDPPSAAFETKLAAAVSGRLPQ